MILLGNNLINAAAATLDRRDHDRSSSASTELRSPPARCVVTFLILVFSEITPKVIGAAYAERIALPAAYVLGPLLQAALPDRLVRESVRQRAAPAAANQARGRSDEHSGSHREELRSLVLEHSHFLPREAPEHPG